MVSSAAYEARMDFLHFGDATCLRRRAFPLGETAGRGFPQTEKAKFVLNSFRVCGCVNN